MFIIFKKISCFLKKYLFNLQKSQNNNPYPVNYTGHNQYDRTWFIAIDDNQNMQLWAMSYKNLIRNCGYYEPYRNVLIIKNITNWK